MYYLKTHSPLPRINGSRLDKLKTFFLPERSASTHSHKIETTTVTLHNQLITEYQGDLVEMIIPKHPKKRECKLKKVMPRLFPKPQVVILTEQEKPEEESIHLESEQDTKQVVGQINTKLNEDDSFFGFIKKKEKLKDIAEHFSDLQTTHPGQFYCKNETLFPKRIDEQSCLKDDKIINLSKLGVGEKYYPLIKELLQKQQNMKSLTFQGNRINDKLLLQLITYFPPVLKDLNLKDNQLGQRGTNILSDFLIQFTNLKILNLSNNLIGDKGGIYLLKSISKIQTISKLNISENNLTDAIGWALHDLLTHSQSLEVLTLSWNQLGGEAGMLIAKGMNRVLKVLDLSYNRIGVNDKAITSWSQTLLHCAQLVHLDLSFNQLSEKQIKILNEALIKNNTLFGLHLEGNKFNGYIDPYGFIQFIADEYRSIKLPIDGVNYITTKMDNKNCCWICQGWVEFRFQYTPEVEEPDTPIFLHLDFLNYKPIPMTSTIELKQSLVEKEQQLQKDNDTTRKSGFLSQEILDELSKFSYTTYQMCPPNRQILYFFSNPITERYFVEPTQEYMPSPHDNLILQGKDPKHQHHRFSDGTILKFKKISYVNFIYTRQEFVIDDKNNYRPLVRLLPRSSEKKYVLRRMGNHLSRQQINFQLWNVDDSYFKQYQSDNEEILNECFQFDWNCSRINRFVKNEYEQMKLKEYLHDNYQLIKDVYKYYSSAGYFTNECFAIPFNNYIKLMQQIGIIDNESVKIQDVEIDLVSIKNNIDPKFMNNPDKTLVRFQFLEMFFRLANDKYVRTNVVKNHADAVYRLTREFKEFFKGFDTCQKWRDKRFWNKECECLLQFKTPFLQKLYDYVADLNNRKWYFKMKWVAVKEFKDFCKLIGLSEFISERLIVVLFNFSIMSQQDELTQDRHLRMTQIEFYESLARLAEYISPCSMIDNENRYLLPLHVKLEALLTHCYYCVVKRSPSFLLFQNYFGKYEQFLPKVKQHRDEEDYQIIDSLTVYNSVQYFDSHKQPYLHPQYQTFLRRNTTQLYENFSRRSTLLSPLRSPLNSLRFIKKSGFVDEPKISPPLSPRSPINRKK